MSYLSLQHIRRKLPFCPAGTHLGSSPLLTLAFIWSALLPSDSSSLSSPLSSCSAALYDLRSESLARTRVLGEQASEAPSAYVPAQVDGQSSFRGGAHMHDCSSSAPVTSIQRLRSSLEQTTTSTLARGTALRTSSHVEPGSTTSSRPS